MNKLSVLTLATLTLGLTVVHPQTVKAATITYDFTVDIPNDDFGSLAGDSFTGDFSFDDADLTGTGDEFNPEFIDVFDLSFNFNGTLYTEADANSPGAEAAFSGNDFLGLSYNVSDDDNFQDFSFVPAFALPIDDPFDGASFTYDLGDGDQGFGDINYTIRDDDPVTNSVPEPATIIGLLSTLVLGSTLKSNKRSN